MVQAAQGLADLMGTEWKSGTFNLHPTHSKHETRIYTKDEVGTGSQGTWLDEEWTGNQGAWLGWKPIWSSSLQVCVWGKGARITLCADTWFLPATLSTL